MRRFFIFSFLILLIVLSSPGTIVDAQAIDTTATETTESPSETPTPTFIFIPVTITSTATRPAATATATASAAAKATTTSSMAEVKRAGIQDDGSIIHVVEKGQALWSIGMEYGVSVENLILFNNLPADPVLQIGQKLIVQPPYTPTPTPTASNTPFPPTPTSTQTLRPITPGPTLSPTPSITPTSQPLFVGVDALKGLNRRSMGIGLIVICALGLGGIIYYIISKRKIEKRDDIDDVEALLSEKQDLKR